MLAPDVSLRAVPIDPVPLLSTPLVKQLTSGSASLRGVGTASAGGPSPRAMGYLTLNQVRKVAPLLETDAALATTPTVGLWVQFAFDDCDGGGADDESSLVGHPFCWGACVKYLASDWLADRRFADSETFLLVRRFERRCVNMVCHVADRSVSR